MTPLGRRSNAESEPRPPAMPAASESPPPESPPKPEGDFLAAMVAAARRRAAEARRERPLTRPSPGAPGGRLRAALAAARREGLGVIAEVKRASPSKGAIAPTLDAAAQARAYGAAGAHAVSVLTEPSRFAGSLADLEAVTAAVDIPVLRKDFIVNRYQVWESAATGAAAILLIAAALDDGELHRLLDECHSVSLDALVEVHEESDLRRAVTAGASLIGVNNRDLRSLTVDLATTERLAPLAPQGTIVVSESGIAGAADARRVATAGAHAVLVGEAFVRCPATGLPGLIAAMRSIAPAAPAAGGTR